jgi:hypothetical protein
MRGWSKKELCEGMYPSAITMLRPMSYPRQICCDVTIFFENVLDRALAISPRRRELKRQRLTRAGGAKAQKISEAGA